MSIDKIFAAYFKPEIQKRGREYFLKDMVFISNASDTQVQGFVKAMSPLKVSFYSSNIASPVFTAQCNCSSAKKGIYCKHMWAFLLAVESKHPDFLDSKKTIEIGEEVAQKSSFQSAAYKEKQTAFKKQQYEKQKAWAKEKRLEKKRKTKPNAKVRTEYSNAVEQALKFFTKNGFAMGDLPDAESLKRARKQLAYIFHPDKGGSHEEAIALNRHFEILVKAISG